MKSMVSAIIRDPFYFSTLFYFSFTYWQNSYFSVDDFAISPPYLWPFMRRVSRIHCFRRMTIYNMPVIPMTSSQIQKLLNILKCAQLGGFDPAETLMCSLPFNWPCISLMQSGWFSISYFPAHLTVGQGEAAVCASMMTTHNSPAPQGKK